MIGLLYLPGLESIHVHGSSLSDAGNGSNSHDFDGVDLNSFSMLSSGITVKFSILCVVMYDFSIYLLLIGHSLVGLRLAIILSIFLQKNVLNSLASNWLSLVGGEVNLCSY